MKTLRKSSLAIAAALGLGLAGAALPVAWADHPEGGHGPDHHGAGMMGHHAGGHRAEWAKQRHEERMELLEYRLKLTPEQRGAWDAFKNAQTAHWATRGGPWGQGDKAGTTAPEHFSNHVQRMEQHLATLKTVEKAARDLYNTLSAEQKTVMDNFFAQRPGPGGGPDSRRQSAPDKGKG